MLNELGEHWFSEYQTVAPTGNTGLSKFLWFSGHILSTNQYIALSYIFV